MFRNSLMLRALFAAALLVVMTTAHALEESHDCRAHLSAISAAAAGGANDRPNYAPDRMVDGLHLKLDVTPDFKARTVSGSAIFSFKPIAHALDQLRLDAVNLRVASVESSVSVKGWQNTDEAIVITFEKPIEADVEAWVKVTYAAEPKIGLYFRTPEMGYTPGDTHIWTQGETHEARHWFPSYDYPNERFTTEIICHVPNDMTVISNGKLVGETESAGGLKAVHWLQEIPHANYLVALCAGYFEKISEEYRGIPMNFYTPRSQIANAANSFRGTADMMKFLEAEIGVPYPWAKYDQVVVDDFTAGGMENTSITILTDRTLFTDEMENIRTSQNLVAHELVHQWFGDYLTCKDWANLWLNEGFATFYAHMYEGHANGRDSMLYGLWRDAGRIFDAGDVNLPIVYRNYKNDMEQFSDRAYEKGSWVLHMLRTQLGEDLYRKCIQTYVERNALKSVVTEDLSSVIEELSGRSFDPFFDQYVYHGGVPSLEIAYAYDDKTKLAKVSVKQTHEVNDKVLLFKIPTKVRFKGEGWSIDHPILIEQKEQDFYFPTESAPQIVRFDPEFGVLARVKFEPPTPMLYAQLADKDDAMGRVLAAVTLKDKKDKETIEKLKAALNEDAFYAVRIEAAKALGGMKTPEAFDALAASFAQSDARVRRQAIESAGSYWSDEARDAMAQAPANEKNPLIAAVAVEALGKYSDSTATKSLQTNLKNASYRNIIADGAIRGMRAADDPSAIKPLMKALRENEKEFGSWSFASAIGTLAHLARHQEDKGEVREFIAGYANHPKRAIRVGAIGALGTLKDPRALALVDSLAGDDASDPVQRAAKDAAKKLRDENPPQNDIGTLRDEMLSLRKDHDKTQKDLDDLKKQMEALAPTPTEAKKE